MTALADRLRYAVATHAAAIPARSPDVTRRAPIRLDLPPIAQILRGDWHSTDHGPVFVRDEWFPLDHQHGSRALGVALDAAPEGLARLIGAGAAPAAARLAFFDIETTGLAGGTGTYIVLAGLGSFEESIPGIGATLAFRMRQYFLADIAQEHAMLAMLAADLARFDGIVTYNGRTFDVPFVETRLTLARLATPCGRLVHFDLLHPVRRLYRHRMNGCRLAEAERRLLGIDRPDDVPGSLIPALYFDYVRAGRAAPLRGVFRHNSEDVLSLVGLLAILAGMLDGRALDPDDAAAVARWWETAGEPRRAADLYRDALPWLHGGEDWAWAATRHAALCRRAGLRDEAAALWAELWESGDTVAGLELAKHLEHHVRDLGAAEAVTRTLLARPQTGGHDALWHRLKRIERKRRAISDAIC